MQVPVQQTSVEVVGNNAHTLCDLSTNRHSPQNTLLAVYES